MSETTNSFVLRDGIVLYNDLTTNHFCLHSDMVCQPVAKKDGGRAYVYDPYTRNEKNVDSANSSVIRDGVILYNDLTTNHFRLLSDSDVITRIRPPVAGKNVDRAYVYDQYTRTMWIVGPTGQLYNSGGRELTLEGYRAHQAGC